MGVAQEKAQAFQGKKIDGQFLFTRDKTVYVNHYYFYIDDADFGPLFCNAPRSLPPIFSHSRPQSVSHFFAFPCAHTCAEPASGARRAPPVCSDKPQQCDEDRRVLI